MSKNAILLRTLSLCAVLAAALILPFAFGDETRGPLLFVFAIVVAIPTILAIQRGWTKWLWAGKLEEARMRAGSSNDPELHVEHGILCALHGRTEEARAAFEKALSISPAHTGALVGLGHLHARDEDWDEALASFERAAAADPKCFAAFYGIGGVHRRRDQYARALAAYEKALAIEEDDAYTLAELARCHLELGDLERAEETLARAESLGVHDRELSRAIREAE